MPPSVACNNSSAVSTTASLVPNNDAPQGWCQEPVELPRGHHAWCTLQTNEEPPVEMKAIFGAWLIVIAGFRRTNGAAFLQGRCQDPLEVTSLVTCNNSSSVATGTRAPCWSRRSGMLNELTKEYCQTAPSQRAYLSPGYLPPYWRVPGQQPEAPGSCTLCLQAAAPAIRCHADQHRGPKDAQCQGVSTSPGHPPLSWCALEQLQEAQDCCTFMCGCTGASVPC
ncbi:uncharacterized protein LOC142590126 [Dermacentor variabilis]|uniref:uncharacterized protein LOC142590126 n=1 Tax=Dermacentor variabilis TaxID=34621 RepID=UPI003F5C1E45